MNISLTAGPKLNRIEKRFTARDPLGIEGVAASISAEICPVVTIVTPRAFYWAFFTWLYYDYYKHSEKKDRTKNKFDDYVKRQDYYFVLANILADTPDRSGMAGVRKAEQAISKNVNGKYLYDKDYLSAMYGGMQYYNAGCIAMNYILDRNPATDEPYTFPKLHKSGEELALAFESIIKDTEYYKQYRLSSDAVPESVLVEYGKAANIGLKGFDKCKELLRTSLFETKKRSKLSESAAYVKHLKNVVKVQDFGTANLRYVLFDYFSPRGEHHGFNDELGIIIRQWEIVVGRHYFTISLGLIFQYLLNQLTVPMTIDEWVTEAFNNARFSFDVHKNLSSIISECIYAHDVRESYIGDARKQVAPENTLENALRLILSVYNRFSERDDFGEEKKYFYYGEDTGSVSLNMMMEQVQRHADGSILSFLQYIAKNWVIDRHYLTSFEKMLQERDGFFFEIIDDRYKARSGKKYDVGIQGIRLSQLHQIMIDLDII